ncbi:NlpC/P60 family protein [Streptomyces sp. NPDC020489]|uniref:C40 family peptidase n=1 Tax=Streptomyces sp. NPDC020489 TaxID=3365077 RepID=UPI003787AE43
MSPEPLLSQSADAAPTREGEAPSREEVLRRINSLYDRAESDTGTFNATRAASIPRRRGTSGDVRAQSVADSELSALTRRWFDMARAKLGPTVAVPQPSGRMPSRAPQLARPARAEVRPARVEERPGQALALEASTSASAPAAWDTGASTPAVPTASAPELTSWPVPESATGTLPQQATGPDSPLAAPDAGLDEGAWRTGEQPVVGEGAWRTGELPVVDESVRRTGELPVVDQNMWRTGELPVIAENPAPWERPETAATQAPSEPSAVTPRTGGYEPGIAADGAATYGVGRVMSPPAAYAAGQWAEPMPPHAAGLPSDAATTTYGAGLPAIPAPSGITPEFTEFVPAAPAFTNPAPSGTTPEFTEFVPTAPAFTAPAPAFTAPPALPEPAVATAFAPAASTWAAAPAAPVAGAESLGVVPMPASFVAGGAATDAGRSTKAERVIAFARDQIGRPCVKGAVGPGSYDAPGLAQAAWRTAGVTLPRTVQAQAECGMPVALADVQIGDLVFFHDDLDHVGIWAGNGMMIHAPGPGAQIREESVFFAGQAAIKGAVRPA